MSMLALDALHSAAVCLQAHTDLVFNFSNLYFF